jgi:hypothetical protein
MELGEQVGLIEVEPVEDPVPAVEEEEECALPTTASR